ncbi:MAG: hypothetical protein CL489_06390 [Acidobacteria bacterium]|nr:hypothetical protein [Acidobacteriota bacterium]
MTEFEAWFEWQANYHLDEDRLWLRNLSNDELIKVQEPEFFFPDERSVSLTGYIDKWPTPEYTAHGPSHEFRYRRTCYRFLYNDMHWHMVTNQFEINGIIIEKETV